MLINIFSTWIYLIYVELIELRFCGCDYNLKKNITKRSKIDAIGNVKLNIANPTGEKIQIRTESDISDQSNSNSELSE